MDLAKKLAKVFSLIFLAVFVASCDSGCVEANEFDKAIVKVSSYPLIDGIDGIGDAQVAKWHDTGLKTNGEGITLQITGAWVPWYGNDDLSGDVQLNALPVCKFCARKDDVQNCICYDNQVPSSEDGYTANDCVTNLTAQNDATKCTCTTKFGNASDYGVYHFPLNKYDKNHDDLKPDFQEPCKYQAGMGLFMGLFGSSGSVIPTRVYHLFSQTPVCDVVKNAQGQCLDADGNDVTKYLFTSANNQIFVKDDNNGNDGPDTNPAGNTYHTRNETAKLIILDSRYDDNYGEYQITFLGGLGDAQDTGLLEFLVSLMEDKIMGTPDSQGVRQGGVIQTMFNQIVLDSGFISILQMGMSFYIIFYGVAVLIGLAEVSKKELTTRMLKIALVMFFTSSSSWYWYDKIVVTFFKDGMDSVITMFMNFSDKNIDPTSGIVTAQMDRASSNSNATRFSYADLIIRNMLSIASAKKIFGLFFGVPLFGPVYIAAIYALIAFFMYVMLTVAMSYVVAVVKLAFVLALGPIFISFTLSSHTNEMFKKWLAFLGARSLEIVFIFLVLYNFLVLIDQNFTSLLSYRACVTQWNLGFFSIPILKSSVNRTLAEWCSSFIMLGGLIFITKLVLDKIPDLAGSLITIGGTANKDSDGNAYGSGGFGAAGGMMGGLMGMAKTVGGAGMSIAATAAAKTYQGASSAMAGTGSSVANTVAGAVRALPGGNTAMDTANKAWNAMPSNPRAMYRNSLIDSAISNAQKSADSKGLTGAAKDEHIRSSVISSMMANTGKGTSIGSSPNTAVALGLNFDTISKRMDEQLVTKPLAEFVKSEAAKMKADTNNPLVGKAFSEELNNRINKWAANSFATQTGDPKKDAQNAKEQVNRIQAVIADSGTIVNGLRLGGMTSTGITGMSNMKDFIKSQSEYTAAEAAKAFKDNPAKQQEYLQHLKDNQFKMESQKEKTAAGAMFKNLNTAGNMLSSAAKAIKPFDDAFGRDAISDPKRAAESFMRKVGNEGKDGKSGTMFDVMRAKTGSWIKHNQGSALNPFNLMKDKGAIKQEVQEGNRSGLIGYLSKDGAAKEQKAIRDHYDAKISSRETAPNHLARKEFEAKKQEKLAESKARREFFKDDLKKVATKLAKKDSDSIDKGLKDIKKLDTKVRDKSKAQNKLKKDIKKQEDALEAQKKKIADAQKKIAEAKEKSDNLRQQSPKPLTKEISDKLEADLAKITKMEKDLAKETVERENMASKLTLDKDKAKIEDAKLELEKKEAMKDIVNLKTEVRSLEDIVKEIKDSERTTPNAKEIMAARALGENAQELRKEEQQRGEDLRIALRDQLRAEYDAALEKHAKLQMALLSEEDRAEIADLKGMELQHELALRLEKAFPSDDEKALAAALVALDDNQRGMIEDNGGLDAIKEGLSEIDGTTLFEKAARLQYFEDNISMKDDDAPEVGSSVAQEVLETGSSVDDIHIELDSTDSESRVILTPEEQELSDKIGAIGAAVQEKIQGDNPDLDQEFAALEELKKQITSPEKEEEYAAPKKDSAKDEDDKDKGKKDDDKKPWDNSGLKSILNVQISILESQIAAAKGRADTAKSHLDQLKVELVSSLDKEVVLRKIAETEATIRSCENDELSLQSKCQKIISDLSGIDD